MSVSGVPEVRDVLFWRVMAPRVKNKKQKHAPRSWKLTAETLADTKLARDIRDGLKDLVAGRHSRVRDDIDV